MKADAGIVLVIGLAFMLNTASCSDLNACAASGATAGAGGSSCATSAASAGAAGATAATTCDQLTALQSCFSAFCNANGAGTPFCTCYTRGYDLGAAPGCACITFNAAAYCQQAEANGLSASDLDCSSATGAVATMCVGVQ